MLPCVTRRWVTHVYMHDIVYVCIRICVCILMYIYICICVFMYKYIRYRCCLVWRAGESHTYILTYMYMYVYVFILRVYSCIDMYVYIRVRVYSCIDICVTDIASRDAQWATHVYVYMQVHVYVCICICTCIFMYRHMCHRYCLAWRAVSHTCICTYIWIYPNSTKTKRVSESIFNSVQLLCNNWRME